MKEIPLTQGKVALVDDLDFEWLLEWKWFAARNNKRVDSKFYAQRTACKNGKKYPVHMHRAIIGETEFHVDHMDGNGLNNQRSNLRTCTRSQNLMNQKSLKQSIKFKGVHFHKRNKRWQAQIQKNRKIIHLGSFDFSVDAAIAYNEAAKRLFGEFASLNEIPE